MMKYAAVVLVVLGCSLTEIAGQHGHAGIHAHDGFVDRHIDPPFTHGNHRAVPAIHTTSVVGGGHPHVIGGSPHVIGGSPHVGHSAGQIVDRHIDPAFTHGNPRPVPVVHTTKVVSGNSHLGHGIVYPGFGKGYPRPVVPAVPAPHVHLAGGQPVHVVPAGATVVVQQPHTPIHVVPGSSLLQPGSCRGLGRRCRQRRRQLRRRINRKLTRGLRRRNFD